MDGSGKAVVVANTFTCRWEMESYISFCKENNIRSQFVILTEVAVMRNLQNATITPRLVAIRVDESKVRDTGKMAIQSSWPEGVILSNPFGGI